MSATSLSPWYATKGFSPFTTTAFKLLNRSDGAIHADFAECLESYITDASYHFLGIAGYRERTTLIAYSAIQVSGILCIEQDDVGKRKGLIVIVAYYTLVMKGGLLGAFH